jgi:hypothetical protein
MPKASELAGSLFGEEKGNRPAIAANEDPQQFAFYSICPSVVPDDRQLAIAGGEGKC